MTKDERELVQHVLSSAKEVLAFRSSLNAETDRGCALMAAAYLAFAHSEKIGAKQLRICELST
jgi:hypothetical protein